MVHLESDFPAGPTWRPPDARGAPAERTLSRVLETMAEGVWELDAEDRVVFANARLGELFAVPVQAMLGRHFLEFVPPENAAAAREIAQAARRGEFGRWEFAHRRPDGVTLEIVLSVSPVVGDEGAVIGQVAVFTDVTALRRAQEQLLHAQKMEALGRLASGVAHDFNNLLVAILGSCEVALGRPDATDGIRAELGHVQHAAWRAADLVRQLLTFGRRSPSRPVVTDLTRVVRGIEKLLRRTLGEHIRVEVWLEPEPWPVRIDPAQLDQVLMNLAVNARDAMPAGGTLVIETRNVEGLERGWGEPGAQRGRWCALVVADDGHGMPPEVRSRIFEPFFTTKGAGQGTGLGLSTVLGIVEQAGGQVRVDSRPGGGSAFRLYFPARVSAAPDEAPAARPPAHDGAGRVVLVVEDDPLVRDVTVRFLELLGYRPRPAERGEDALALPLDDLAAVVSDVVMPGLSGPELAQRLRAERPGLPVVLVSGYTGEQAPPLPEGALLLPKPFTRASLGAALARVIGGASAGAAAP